MKGMPGVEHPLDPSLLTSLVLRRRGLWRWPKKTSAKNQSVLRTTITANGIAINQKSWLSLSAKAFA
jgi:hypothetical protein